jgi:hypothetical protein
VVSCGWGLSGGIFSPTLFMGAMLGSVIAHVVHPFNGPAMEPSLVHGQHGRILCQRDRAHHVDSDHL